MYWPSDRGEHDPPVKAGAVRSAGTVPERKAARRAAAPIATMAVATISAPILLVPLPPVQAAQHLLVSIRPGLVVAHTATQELARIAHRGPPKLSRSALRARCSRTRTAFGRQVQHLRRLVGVEIEPVDQDERLALARRQHRHRAAYVFSIVNERSVIGGGSLDEHPPSPNRESAQSIPMDIERRSEHVPSRRIHGAHPVPALQDPRHRLLGNLLGFEPVAGEQVEGLAEPLILGLEERLEALDLDRGGCGADAQDVLPHRP